MNTGELLTVIETDISFVNQQRPELKKVSIGVSINANVMLHDMYEKCLSLGLKIYFFSKNYKIEAYRQSQEVIKFREKE